MGSSDRNTITCPITGGLTYVPIPPSSGENFAGLLTVELTPYVKKGQLSIVIIRRATTVTTPREPGIPKRPPALRHNPKPNHKAPIAIVPKAKTAVSVSPDTYRVITGVFQVNIPIDEETLSIFKWRLFVIPPSNHWYPVLLRYTLYLLQCIDGHGEDSGSITASPTDLRPKLEIMKYCAKVRKVCYDCCDVFAWFVLGCCKGKDGEGFGKGNGGG